MLALEKPREETMKKAKSFCVPYPICKRKAHTNVCTDTMLLKSPLYCCKCKRKIRIDVVQLRIVLSD